MRGTLLYICLVIICSCLLASGSATFAYVSNLGEGDEFYLRRTRVLFKQLKYVHRTTADVVFLSCGYSGVQNPEYDPNLLERSSMKPTVEYLRSHGAVLEMLDNCNLGETEEIRRDWLIQLECTTCFISRTKYSAVIMLDNDLLFTENLDHLFPAIPPNYALAVRDASTRTNGGVVGLGVSPTLGSELRASLISTKHTCHGGANDSEWNMPYWEGGCQAWWNKPQSTIGAFFSARHRLISLDRKYNYGVNPRVCQAAAYVAGLPLSEVSVFHYIGCKNEHQHHGNIDFWTESYAKVKSRCREVKLHTKSIGLLDQVERQGKRIRTATHLCERIACAWRDVEMTDESDVKSLAPVFPSREPLAEWARGRHSFPGIYSLDKMKSRTGSFPESRHLHRSSDEQHSKYREYHRHIPKVKNTEIIRNELKRKIEAKLNKVKTLG
ncbi:hypothetical protein RI054_16g76960 [Pseudoscourfieldia marina]